MELAITGASALSNFNEPKRLQFADGWCDRVPMDAVFHEIIVGNREVTVLNTAVEHCSISMRASTMWAALLSTLNAGDSSMEIMCGTNCSLIAFRRLFILVGPNR